MKSILLVSLFAKTSYPVVGSLINYTSYYREMFIEMVVLIECRE